jgi:hypothetical protein
MTDSKTFKYKNRLAGTVASKGGMTVGEATEAAQAQIEIVREPTIAHIDAALATILAMRDELKAGSDPGALSQMYGAANRIVATAGFFELEELGQAAYCLCELVSRFQAGGTFNMELTQVIIEGLRLLREPDRHSAAHREAVLVGLNQVVGRVLHPVDS